MNETGWILGVLLTYRQVCRRTRESYSLSIASAHFWSVQADSKKEGIRGPSDMPKFYYVGMNKPERQRVRWYYVVPSPYSFSASTSAWRDRPSMREDIGGKLASSIIGWKLSRRTRWSEPFSGTKTRTIMLLLSTDKILENSEQGRSSFPAAVAGW